MSELAAELERLRRLAGVEPGFTDYRGRWHPLAAGELARLLAALGYDTSDAAGARAAADRLETGRWTRVLEPVAVLPAGLPGEVPTAMIAPVLPVVRWEVIQEDGAILSGEAEPAAWPLAEEQELGGLWYQRRRLPLPPLPAGYHRLALRRADGELLGSACLIAAPERCYLPPFLAQGRRCWGPAVQLYSLRSERNWGIGDFTDLAGFAAAAAQLGADLVGLNPLHALFPAAPERCSPYSPSSRLFLNPLYLDPEAVPEFERAPVRNRVASPDFQRRLEALRAASHVDYAAVSACKLGVLRELFTWFEAHAEPARQASFEAFRAQGGPALEHFTRHQAGGAAEEARWHCWLQWLARAQLDRAAQAARAAGMAIGLYLDLAVGPDPAGAEADESGSVFSAGASVGAPPDPLAPQGQDWGIPPWHPQRLREQEYAPFVRLLRANMPAGGALRIDHVMMLLRLWWVPRGQPSSAGGYVRYPLEELMAIVALESQRQQCLVIGEDLGTVPDEVRAAMARHGLFSYRVLMFEREPDGSFRPPAAYPHHSLVAATTHDLPTLEAYWRGDDLALRVSLGLYPGDAVPREDCEEREAARAALVAALARAGLLEPTGTDPAALAPAGFAEAAQLYVAHSESAVLMLQPEDWLGERRPVNVPGTHESYPNWRRKLPVAWPVFMGSARVRELAERVNRARGRAPTRFEDD